MQKLPIRIKEQLRQTTFHVGRNLWKPLCAYLEEFFPNYSVFLITDSNLADIYAETARKNLRAFPGFCDILVFPGGEQNKSRAQKERLEDLLLVQKAGRDSVLVAMGGGVTGDLAGYVAATLHRGVPLIHLPTSLLAQVDSSIGGKVGINHPAGKNLIGAFYQPDAIFCDVDFLQTLPEEEFVNGMAEVIKYAVILDDQLWNLLEAENAKVFQRYPETLEEVIVCCARWKIKVVEADEKESGYRSILNFGHTVGHALEKLSGYQIKHGFAVAVGMKVAARLSQRLLNYPPDSVQRIEKLFHTYHLNRIDLKQFSPDEIWETIKSDKKARRQEPRFTLMNSVNQPELFYPVEKQEFKDVLSS